MKGFYGIVKRTKYSPSQATFEMAAGGYMWATQSGAKINAAMLQAQEPAVYKASSGIVEVQYHVVLGVT